MGNCHLKTLTCNSVLEKTLSRFLGRTLSSSNQLG